jgi:short-subunit dehydrogenase
MSYALITGGSKGIGREMAFLLAAKGYNILLVARSSDELKLVKSELETKFKVKADIFQSDLSHPDSPKQIYDWCETNKFDINILINNAGYGLWGYVEDLSVEAQLSMIQLNVNALAELTLRFIPILKRTPKAYIMNVASTTAYQAVPTLAAYAATKSFVVLFTRGLRFELKNSSISVTCLSPGATDTNFTNRAGMQAMQAVADKFNMKADVVAKIAVKGMFNTEAEIIPGFVNWISVMATYYLPKSVIEAIAANLYVKHLKR